MIRIYAQNLCLNEFDNRIEHREVRAFVQAFIKRVQFYLLKRDDVKLFNPQ